MFLEPHILRMKPRSDSSQRLIDFSLDVSPTPAGVADCVDLDGNSCSTLWFDGKHQRLCITVNSNVETLVSNPFNFMITSQGACNVPASYHEPIREQLGPYLGQIAHDRVSADFGAAVILETGRETVAFLCWLAAKISNSFKKVVRPNGDAFEPAVTLKRGQGACRDLTVLFMEACRSVGLASRFVSGYMEGFSTRDDGDLHAWAEIYLPGAGWRGFDPTLGLAVADRHVAIAASPTPAGAAPVSGSFRADSATARFRYEVSVKATYA